MIQYPTNVTPHNYAFDATVQDGKSVISYTFNGDILTDSVYKIYDYDTMELVYKTAQYHRESLDVDTGVYNGHKVAFSIPANTLTNGKDYIMQMMLCQRNADKTEYIYDMPVLGGKIEGVDTSNPLKLYVESNITSIYPFNENDGVYSPDGYAMDAMAIKINGELKRIVKYTSEVTVNDIVYGCIEIESAFPFDISQGISYDIYSNSIVTPQYVFSCRTTPTIDFDLSFNNDYIHCTGNYNQSENKLIKYFILKLYWSNNDSFWSVGSAGEKTKLVAETEKIYAQNIRYDFIRPYFHDETYSGTSDYYKVVCDIVTQDNMSVSIESDVFQISPNETYQDNTDNVIDEYLLFWNSKKGCVVHGLKKYCSGGSVSGSYILYRTDLDTGEEIVLHPHSLERRDGVLYGYDMTASTHGNYKYTIKKYDDNGAIIIPNPNDEFPDIVFPTNTINTSEDAWYITELNIQEDSDLTYHPNTRTNKKIQFTTGDTWKFFIDLADTTVTNNLDRMTHVGYGRYVSSTSTNVNYMSGTLSAMIGYMDCTTNEYTDTIALVNAWRKFITQNKPFLLKSQKGDVWVVNITDNPTTTYQETYRGTPTTISFSWAECYHINDIELYDPNMSFNTATTFRMTASSQSNNVSEQADEILKGIVQQRKR